MRHSKSFRQPRRRAEDADVLIVGFERRKNFVAGLATHPVSHLRQTTQVCMKEAWQICEANRPRHIHADLSASAGKFLSQVLQRVLHIAEQSRRFAVKKFAGKCDTNSTGCPFKQLNSETVLNALHLPRDGALSQSRNFGRLRKTTVLHDQVKKREFIQVKRHCAEELMHVAHQYMTLMNFSQQFFRL